MATTITDAALLNKALHRRRWLIRICISSLFILLMMAVIGFIMFGSSENNIEQAKAIYAQITNKSTRAEVENLLGKAQNANSIEGIKIIGWTFREQSFNQIDYYRIYLFWTNDGGVTQKQCNEESIKGWAVWKWRWMMLKSKLGF